eukprot:sb/3472637/
MSGTRTDIPGEDEIMREMRKEECKRVVIKRLDHAAAPGLDPATARENRGEPKTRGDSFEPGEWMPAPKVGLGHLDKSKIQNNSEKFNNNEEQKLENDRGKKKGQTHQPLDPDNGVGDQKFEPESWTPGGGSSGIVGGSVGVDDKTFQPDSWRPGDNDKGSGDR